MVPQEVLDQIIEAGTYAANGRNAQSPIIIQVTNKEVRDKLSEMNREIAGAPEGFDPFYGAPAVLIVLAKKDWPTHVYDGSLVMGNLMLAAHELGIEEEYEGIGHCVLGYVDGEYPNEIPRNKGRVFYVK